MMETSQTDALVAGQVTPAVHLGEADSFEQRAHRLGLIEAVLQQQPAAGLQMGRCYRCRRRN